MRALTYGTKDWLSLFCCSKNPDELGSPFLVQGTMRAATDGVIAVMTHEKGPVKDLPETKKHTVKTIKRFVERTGFKAQGEISREALLRIAGPGILPEERKCGACQGTGQVVHDCGCKHCEVQTENCLSCEGKKVHLREAPYRRALLCGHSVDRNRLACLAHYAPSSMVYSLLYKGGDNCYMLATEKWLAVFVGMSHDKEAEDGSPDLTPEFAPTRSIFERPTVEANTRSIQFGERETRMTEPDIPF